MSPFQTEVKEIQMMETKRADNTKNGRDAKDWYQDKREKIEEKMSEKGRWMKNGGIEEARLYLAESVKERTNKLRPDITLD